MKKKKVAIDKPPLLSVVTVVRDDREAFVKTLHSIRSQTFESMEHIIIDGSDGSDIENEISSYLSGGIKYLHEPDQGIYDAMNKGLALAEGEWVQFLNAGDMFHSSDTIQQVMGQDQSDSDVIYGDSLADYGKFRKYQKAGAIGSLWKGMPFRHQAVFFRRTVLEGMSFDLFYTISTDFDLICTLFKAKHRFKYVTLPVVTYDAFGLSNQRMVKSFREQYRIARKYFPFSLAMHLRNCCRVIFIGMIHGAKRVSPRWLYLQCIILFHYTWIVRK